MPPKESKEQQLKNAKKEREEKLLALKKWNSDEFSRLEKVKRAYLEHWTEMAKYVTSSEQEEKQRLAKESANFNNLLNEICGQYSSELDMVKQQLDWDEFLKTVTPEDNPQTVITALESLQKSIKFDSTVQSLRMQLGSIPIMRQFLEDKKTIYDVYVSICRKLADLLQKLQKYVDFDLPYKNRMEELQPRINQDLTLTQNQLGLLIKTQQQEQHEIQDLFIQRRLFEAQGEPTELLKKTLSNQLVTENKVPAELIIPELEPPKKDDKKKPEAKKEDPAAAAAQKAEDKKNKKKNAVEIVQVDPSEEIIYFASQIESRLAHPELFVQFVNKQVEDFTQDYQKTLLTETQPFVVTEEMQNNPLPPSSKSEDRGKKEAKIVESIKQMTAQRAWLDSIKIQSYVSPAEMEEFQKISIVQQQRILLRAYLYEFQERAVKYVLDNNEIFQDQNELIKMTTPLVEQNAEEEQQYDEASEEGGEEEEEDAAPKKSGLNSQMLKTLNEQSQKLSKTELEPKKSQVMQVQSLDRLNSLENSDSQLELSGDNVAGESKFQRLTYRSKNQQYNDRNVTSRNEIIILENYRKLYPSLRLSMKINYIIDRQEGWFLTRKDPQILPQLCRTHKNYYSGSMQQLGIFFGYMKNTITYKSKQQKAVQQSNLTQSQQAVPQVQAEVNPKLVHSLHEINYLQGLWVNTAKANQTSKISFASGIKVTLPHNLMQQPIGVVLNMISSNIMGSHMAEGYDQIVFRNLPKINYEQFYVQEDLQKTGNRNNIMNLLINLSVYKYVQPNTGSIVGYVSENDIQRQNEMIDTFLKNDHCNIVVLNVCMKKMKEQLVQQNKKLYDFIIQINTINIYQLTKTTILNDIVKVFMTIQFINDEIKKLEFKIAQEYYRLMRETQNKKVEAEKKKKGKVQRLTEYLKENQVLLKQIILNLDPDIVKSAQAYFDSLFVQLEQIQEQVKKPKQRVPIPRTLDILKETQADKNEEKTTIQVPELIPISNLYQTDLVGNQQKAQEVNKWNISELHTEDINQAVQNHQAFQFDDDQIDETEFYEEQAKIEFKTYDGKPIEAKEAKLVLNPVKYQIQKLKEMKSKSQNLQKTGPNPEELFQSYNQKHATVLYPISQVSEVRYFKPISLLKPYQQLKPFYDNQQQDRHWDISEVNEEKAQQFDPATNNHLILKNYLLVDHRRYPITSPHHTVYPQFPLLRISEVVKQRTKMGVMDSCMLWNYVPNVFDYQQSVMNREFSQGDQSQDDKKSVIVPLQFEIQLSNELRSTVKSVVSIADAQIYLSKAYWYKDYSELVGKFFVGIWNVATNSFDIDGVEKVDFKKDTGVIQIQATKCGTFALCALKQNCVPFRGWALVPDRSRGEGYDISQVVDEYQRYINDMIRVKSPVMTMNMTGTQQSDMEMSMRNSGMQSSNSLITRTRYAYYQPSRILARTGAQEDVPLSIQAQDIQIPHFIQRSILLAKEDVLIHSVLLKLLLPQNLLLTIRILPEGYEAVDIREQQIDQNERLRIFRDKLEQLRVQNQELLKQYADKLKADFTKSNPAEAEMYDPTQSEEFQEFAQQLNDKDRVVNLKLAQELSVSYTNFQSFYVQMRQEGSEVPKLFKNVVFLTVKDLLQALSKAGIQLEFQDSLIEKTKIQAKDLQIDCEVARQLAVLVCSSQNNQPCCQTITHSPWNRFLPQKIKTYPTENQFQLSQNMFDNSTFMSRGYIPPENVKLYIETELKRRKLENKAVFKYMKEKNVDEKMARKAVVVKNEEKIEKGAPSRLGPAPYGLTSEFVDMRSNAIQKIENFMVEYLSAVDQLREVQYKNAACFVVTSPLVKFETENGSVLPIDEHKKRLANAPIPQMKEQKPIVPDDPTIKKKKAKKVVEIKKEVQEEVIDESKLRCTQTKPFIAQEIKDAYTVCINKCGLGDQYLVHAASVPIAGPAENEQFCNMSLPGTQSHSSCLGLLGDDEKKYDPLLVMKVFELLNALRLGTLG
ncbi:Conserved_hypothetical protein [Hexamita inflata]|uniref:Uncharacterized protein n=1 Tax=Hexamita inflata TaxID=28002 RepID=A0ABP1HR52_9EUKA